MNFREQRRYPRALLKPALAEVIAVLGAQVTWPNDEASDVLDLSYKGAAVRRPGMFPVAVQNQMPVQVKLGIDKPFEVFARVAWSNLEWVGLEFNEVPAEGHQAMTDFLDAKLLGAAMRPVEKVLFSASSSFTSWYQGPGGVHVFVWMNSNRLIDRINVDFGTESVFFERGQPRVVFSREQRKALLVLSQMDKPDLPMEEFVRTFALGV
ncbi:MAG: PilZ domain-containing protein [Bdellovibrionales bacterium]|nr:PilZ domain-containing protein [Bdellovibrionales bacterium]